MTVTEKVSYLKGLAEGLGIDESEKNGKMIKAIIDVLEDIGLELGDIVAGRDRETGIFLKRPVSRRIIKTDGLTETITYEVEGED